MLHESSGELFVALRSTLISVSYSNHFSPNVVSLVSHSDHPSFLRLCSVAHTADARLVWCFSQRSSALVVLYRARDTIFRILCR